MAKIDDLLQRRAKQIVLAVVALLAHGSSLTANLAVKGIMSPASRKSQNARNPTSTPGFLAKSITCSGQITTINQSLPNSSRATRCSLRCAARSGGRQQDCLPQYRHAAKPGLR